MPKDIQAYHELVQMPWGKMFYDIVYLQLDLPTTPKLRVLDFGSGFGVCASHYAQWHDITAIEPNTDMTALRFTANQYKQINGDITALRHYKNEFDLVICHNVLEYAQNKEEILAALASAAKPGGNISIVKHNIPGRIMAAAVFDEDPQKASKLYDDTNADSSSTFGDRSLYSNNDLLAWASKNNLTTKAHYGVRAFYALTQNNSIKFDTSWYEKMLALEHKMANVDEFRKIAFLNHFVLKK